MNQRATRLTNLLSWLVGAVAVLAAALALSGSALWYVRGDTDDVARTLRVSTMNAKANDCRTRAAVLIDHIKDDPQRNTLAIELIDPLTTAERRSQLAQIFEQQAEQIAQLEDKRLKC